ncbi:MAG: ubiquinol-cytochrome c reductase iron-sulfur subunit [Candidatus Hodgkinia cicadicola]
MLEALMPVLSLESAKLFCAFAYIILAIGAGIISWPLACQFLPNAYASINSKLEIDLRTISCGQCATVNWFGTPVFVRNRLLNEIKTARLTRICELKDKYARNANISSAALAFDSNRCCAKSNNWLVAIAPCTHLGCIPSTTKYGWVCACHSSNYDLSGRVISGPAPANLSIPKCVYSINTLILEG